MSRGIASRVIQSRDKDLGEAEYIMNVMAGNTIFS